MKVGDKIYSTKVRPNEIATIIKADINIREGAEKKSNKQKKQIRSTYRAEYEDGSLLIFYGFDIGRSIFKSEEVDGQMTLEGWLREKGE